MAPGEVHGGRVRGAVAAARRPGGVQSAPRTRQAPGHDPARRHGDRRRRRPHAGHRRARAGTGGRPGLRVPRRGQPMRRSGRRRRNAGTTLAVVAALFGLVATMGASPSPSAATGPSAAPTPSAQKVTFVYGDTSEPGSLNPMIGYLATEFYFWAWTYHLPISFAVNDLGAAPDLVTHVDTSADGQTFTYTIRDDVTWSDGVPLTAKDVAFTLNLYKSKHAYLPQTYVKLLDSITAPNDTTVVLHSSQPTSLFSGAVPYLYTYILPEHVWGKLDQPKNYSNAPEVSSGPFYIAEYQRGQFVRLERNKYWTGPDPHVDEIIYRIFKNEDAEAEALKSGEIDFGYFDSANVLNSLKGQPNIGTEVGTVPEFDELAMNSGSASQKPEGGMPLYFRYYVRTENQNTVKAAPFIQDWLKQIGIKTEVTALTDGRLTDEINAGTYDLFQWDWLPDPDPDSLLAYFTCDQRPPDGNTYGNNDSYHCDPVYDRLYQAQRTTLDPQKRLDIIHEMQKRFYDDCTYAVLWYAPLLQAYRTDSFTGFRPQPAPQGDLLDGYSRDAVLDIRPVSASAGGEAAQSTRARGIPAGVWIAIAAVVVLAAGAVVMVRRRGAEERE